MTNQTEVPEPGTFVPIPDALRGHVLGQEVRAFLRGSDRGTAA